MVAGGTGKEYSQNRVQEKVMSGCGLLPYYFVECRERTPCLSKCDSKLHNNPPFTSDSLLFSMSIKLHGM
jgi:hypothetical protein